MRRKKHDAAEDVPLTGKAYLWVVAFTFFRPRRGEHGSFQLIVRARTAAEAMRASTTRLRTLANTTGLFEEPVEIYDEGLIRLEGSFDEATLLNITKHQAGEPLTTYIPLLSDRPLAVDGYRLGDRERAAPVLVLGSSNKNDVGSPSTIN